MQRCFTLKKLSIKFIANYNKNYFCILMDRLVYMEKNTL